MAGLNVARPAHEQAMLHSRVHQLPTLFSVWEPAAVLTFDESYTSPLMNAGLDTVCACDLGQCLIAAQVSAAHAFDCLKSPPWISR